MNPRRRNNLVRILNRSFPCSNTSPSCLGSGPVPSGVLSLKHSDILGESVERARSSELSVGAAGPQGLHCM